MYWTVLDCTGLYLAILGCTGLYLAVLDCTGLYWAVQGFNWECGGEGGERGDLQPISKVIGFQKMYGLIGLNRRIQEKTCDVTLVT